MGKCCSKQNVKEPVATPNLLQEPGSPAKVVAKAASPDIVHRLVRMQIQTGTLDQILAFVSRAETVVTLRNIAGLLDIEIIAVSNGLICAHTRYKNTASMEEAEPKVREVLKPITEYFAGPPERSLAIGGTVSLAGEQVWILSKCADDVHHRLARMPLQSGALDGMLDFMSRPETLETLKSITGLLDMEIIVVSDGLICEHTRYKNKWAMEQAEPKVRDVLKPITKYFTGDPERSLAAGGMVSLAGQQAWMLSKCASTNVVASMLATSLQEPVANPVYLPEQEAHVDGDAVNGDCKNSWLCCN